MVFEGFTMKVIPFKSSSPFSLGVELEFQIIDPVSCDLISKAKDLMRSIHEGTFQEKIKPEITQSMIEINSSVHHSPRELIKDLYDMRNFLLNQARAIGVKFSGGGTHPFQQWSLTKIFPTKRFKKKSHLYRYLSKRSTVFGQHIHVGCESADDALYLSHALARYVPHFIAMSASSPFYQGIDTGFHSARTTMFNAFPLSGHIPLLTSWEEFSNYYYKMRSLGILESMKDVYWDLRPKPEFGTVEIRVCDTPLSIKKAVNIAAYVQTVSHYLLHHRPIPISQDLYDIYNYNRFQSSRFGFDGEIILPETHEHILISDDILNTIKTFKNSANHLKTMGFISKIVDDVINRSDDSTRLREVFKKNNNLNDVVSFQCKIWEKN